MITLNLTCGKDLMGIYIRLPSAQEKIKEAVARLDAISVDAMEKDGVVRTRIATIRRIPELIDQHLQE